MSLLSRMLVGWFASYTFWAAGTNSFAQITLYPAIRYPRHEPPQPESAKDGLEILFAYTEREHAFVPSEVDILIAAIDSLKVLDFSDN